MLVHELKTIAPLYLHLLKNNTTFRARAYSPDYSVRDFYAQQRMRNAVLRNQLRFSATKLFLHESVLMIWGRRRKTDELWEIYSVNKIAKFLENQTDLPFCKRCVLHDRTCDMKKMNNVNR